MTNINRDRETFIIFNKNFCSCFRKLVKFDNCEYEKGFHSKLSNWNEVLSDDKPSFLEEKGIFSDRLIESDRAANNSG